MPPSEMWKPIEASRLEKILNDARLIISGPLNDAYELRYEGRRYFLRLRTIVDPDYGQQFAAERIVYPLIPKSINVPALLQIGSILQPPKPFAIFDFVEDKGTEWHTGGSLDDLCEILLGLHSIAGGRFGDVGGDVAWPASDAKGFFTAIFASELERLTEHSDVEPFVDLLTMAELFSSETPVLCHGDIHRGNFLTGDRGLVVIDWEASRWRVPSADFNQMHIGWLSLQEQQHVAKKYVAATSRDYSEFVRQIACLRAFWHIRTWNFTAKSGRRVFGLDGETHRRLGRKFLAEAMTKH